MIFSNLKKRLQAEYGKIPDTIYFDGDMEKIRAHYDFRLSNELDEFLIDDITWHDLSMDDLFKLINPRLTTSGEQYLYYLLRNPALKEETYEKRRELIELMEKNPDLRLKLQVVFTKLGKSRDAMIHQAFVPSHRGYGRLFLYILLVLIFIISGTGTALGSLSFSVVFIFSALFNILFHILTVRGIESDLETMNYLIALVSTAKRLKKLSFPELNKYLSRLSEAIQRLKTVYRIGGVVRAGDANGNEATFLFSMFYNNLLMLDLITYELLKKTLTKHYQEIFHIHEMIGLLDASIAVASYRESLDAYTLPTLNFGQDVDTSLQLVDVVHPLIKNPVANSLDTSVPILLTGSNASGKSTFLKSIALNMIMAQSICTVLAKKYVAPAFYIYSSMAIADNLILGDSYFIAEIKSIKRIVDVLSTNRPVFCVIDEILRGTNTVERISASSELLKLMAKENALCMAATHDIELCELLKEDYQILHFTEFVTDNGEIVFDYKVRTGPAMTHNAIKLLDALGFHKGLIQAANARASLYSESRKWN